MDTLEKDPRRSHTPLKGLFVNTVSFPIENEFTLSHNIFSERGKPPFFFAEITTLNVYNCFVWFYFRNETESER